MKIPYPEQVLDNLKGLNCLHKKNVFQDYAIWYWSSSGKETAQGINALVPVKPH